MDSGYFWWYMDRASLEFARGTLLFARLQMYQVGSAGKFGWGKNSAVVWPDFTMALFQVK